jgi:hypothetical protein
MIQQYMTDLSFRIPCHPVDKPENLHHYHNGQQIYEIRVSAVK